MTKTVYQTDPAGVYLGPLDADESPLEPGVWLIPAGCVEIAPPGLDAGQAARWTGGAWVLVPDHRGETWWTAEGQAIVIREVGDPAALGLSSAAPDPVPPSITRRQCALELHARGLIGDDEAVAMAATATPPVLLADLLGALSPVEQVTARIDFAATTYERGNRLLDGLMTAAGASPADIDAFFRAAAAR